MKTTKWLAGSLALVAVVVLVISIPGASGQSKWQFQDLVLRMSQIEAKVSQIEGVLDIRYSSSGELNEMKDRLNRLEGRMKSVQDPTLDEIDKEINKIDKETTDKRIALLEGQIDDLKDKTKDLEKRIGDLENK
jgi:chromosome segregation ATPase